MLLLYVFLLSCCLSGSMGRATEEFQKNFKALVALAKNKVFLPVPDGNFECNHVPCHLKRTVNKLKHYFKNSEMRAYISLMEKNMDHIISTLNKGRTNLEDNDSCLIAEVSLQRAPGRYRMFFQKLHEMC